MPGCQPQRRSDQVPPPGRWNSQRMAAWPLPNECHQRPGQRDANGVQARQPSRRPQPDLDDNLVGGHEATARQWTCINYKLDPHQFPPDWCHITLFSYVCFCNPLYAVAYSDVKRRCQSRVGGSTFRSDGGVLMTDDGDAARPHRDAGDVDGGSQRWDRVFADLEAQARTYADGELADEIADRTRREWARISLADRLGAARLRTMSIRVHDAPAGFRALRLTVSAVGTDWFLGASHTGSVPVEWLLPTSSLLTVDDLGGSARSPDTKGLVDQRYDFSAILRGWVRDRRPVVIGVAGVGEVSGTLDRAGRDHVDIGLHHADDFRRSAELSGTQTIALGAIRWIRRR